MDKDKDDVWKNSTHTYKMYQYKQEIYTKSIRHYE